MKVLRINLHVREDISPRLFQALVNIPPRPRAELLRKIAEAGLQIMESPVSSLRNSPMPIRVSHEPREMTNPDATKNGFTDDIENLVGSELSLT